MVVLLGKSTINEGFHSETHSSLPEKICDFEMIFDIKHLFIVFSGFPTVFSEHTSSM